MPTRREASRLFGSSMVPTAVLGAAVGSAVATTALSAETPDYVSRSYDEDLLKKWQPRLYIGHLDIQPYAAKAYVTRSTEHSTVALSYWHTYRGQEGVVGVDSHFGDHEPVVMFIDENDSTLQRMVYSGYHWFAGRSVDPRPTGQDRVRLRAAKPWHHHFLTEDVGTLVELEHLTDDELSNWLVNDWPAHVPAIARPWEMQTRASWWNDDVGAVSFEGVILRAYYYAGLYGADQADSDNLDL